MVIISYLLQYSPTEVVFSNCGDKASLQMQTFNRSPTAIINFYLMKPLWKREFNPWKIGQKKQTPPANRKILFHWIKKSQLALLCLTLHKANFPQLGINSLILGLLSPLVHARTHLEHPPFLRVRFHLFDTPNPSSVLT